MDSKQYYITLPDQTQKGPYDEKDLITGLKRVNTQKARLYGMREWIAGYSLKQ